MCGFFLGFAGFLGVVVVLVTAASDVWVVVVECVAAAPPHPAKASAAAMKIGRTRRMGPLVGRSAPSGFRVQNPSGRETSRLAAPGLAPGAGTIPPPWAGNRIAPMEGSGSASLGPQPTRTVTRN